MTPEQLCDRIESDCLLLAKCFADAGRNAVAEQVREALVCIWLAGPYSEQSPAEVAHELGVCE